MKDTIITEKGSFAGVEIAAGIDAHLKQWNVYIYVGDRPVKVFQQAPSPEQLYKYLATNYPGGTYRSAYEAGYFGFVAHRELEKLGIKNLVVNASDVPTTDREKRRKSDAVDAKKIAEGLVKDKLTGIYIPSEEQEADRHLVRYRIKVVRKEVTRTKQRLKSFLVSKGRHREIDNYFKPYWSKATIEQLKQLDFSCPSDKLVLDHMLADLAVAKKRLYEVDRQLVQLSKMSKYKELVDRLRSIPGIGLITAMTLITELIDMNRFSSLDKLSSYVGVVPDVAGSDKKNIVKGITTRSNKELRRLLIQAAWAASSKDLTFISLYHQQLNKNGKIAQKAIVRVARKLLSVVRAVWIKKEAYKAPELKAA